MNNTATRKALVDQVMKMQAYSGFYPNSTLEADWDVLREIKEALKAFDKRFEIQWVKGHQDEKKPWDELSDAAKANCHADRLANAYREQYAHEDLNHVKRFPSNKAQEVEFLKGTITRGLKTEV